MADERAMTPSPRPETTPDPGIIPDPNPGERSALDDAQGVRYYSTGVVPPRGNRVGGGQEIDTGARVGIMRNLEFGAGGRAHRTITGTHSSIRPTLDPKTRQIHTSTASDSGEPSLGSQAHTTQGESLEAPVEGAGAAIDSSDGNVSPDRRRDKRTP
jgi:hypothetical protein